MQTIETNYANKSLWGEGPWQQEPDKKQWLDTATGYPCLIVRNPAGALCGYVGVSPKHPAYEQDYNDVAVDCHGGLTFSAHCQVGGHICHETETEDAVWWLGFDCGHSCDYSPNTEWRSSGEYRSAVLMSTLYELVNSVPNHGDYSYKDFAFVADQVESLARQLKAMEVSHDN